MPTGDHFWTNHEVRPENRQSVVGTGHAVGLEWYLDKKVISSLMRLIIHVFVFFVPDTAVRGFMGSAISLNVSKQSFGMDKGTSAMAQSAQAKQIFCETGLL